MLSYLQGERPVNQIQIQVIQTQVLQGSTNRRLDSVTAMAVAPQFAGNVKVFTFYDAFGYFCGNPFADFFFVAVDMSAVKMTIAYVDGIFNGLRHFTWFWLEGKHKQNVQCVSFLVVKSENKRHVADELTAN